MKLINPTGYANSMNENMDMAFDRDYDTSSIQRLLTGKDLTIREFDDQKARLRSLIKKAYPTIVNLFYYMQAV
jgi:hypothetical protein